MAHGQIVAACATAPGHGSLEGSIVATGLSATWEAVIMTCGCGGGVLKDTAGVIMSVLVLVAWLSSSALSDDARVGVICEDNWGIRVIAELAKVSKSRGCPLAAERDLAKTERFTSNRGVIGGHNA